MVLISKLLCVEWQISVYHHVSHLLSYGYNPLSYYGIFQISLSVYSSLKRWTRNWPNGLRINQPIHTSLSIKQTWVAQEPMSPAFNKLGSFCRVSGAKLYYGALIPAALNLLISYFYWLLLLFCCFISSIITSLDILYHFNQNKKGFIDF